MKADRRFRGVAFLKCDTDERVTASAAYRVLKFGEQSLFQRIFERWADGKNIDSEFHFFTDEYNGKYRNCFVATINKHWLYGCHCRPKGPVFYQLCVLVLYVKNSKPNDEAMILQDCSNLYFFILKTARQFLSKPTQRRK
jgi:hypothetical protein